MVCRSTPASSRWVAEGMAQRVDAGGVGQVPAAQAAGTCVARSGPEHRAVAGSGWEQPQARPTGLPVPPEGFQQSGRERRMAILAAFALGAP